jgi:uncharacterized protein (TIGR02246 family)
VSPLASREDAMTARSPEDIDRLFAERMAAGDIDGVIALYEANGALLSPEGVATTGPAAIRGALARLAAMRPQMTMNLVRVVRTADDLAVAYNDWKLSAVDAEGRPVTMQGKAVEVSRRQADGSWLFVLDDPFGRG